MTDLNKFGDYQTDIPDNENKKKQQEVIDEVNRISADIGSDIEIDYGDRVYLNGLFDIEDLENIISLKKQWENI